MPIFLFPISFVHWPQTGARSVPETSDVGPLWSFVTCPSPRPGGSLRCRPPRSSTTSFWTPRFPRLTHSLHTYSHSRRRQMSNPTHDRTHTTSMVQCGIYQSSVPTRPSPTHRPNVKSDFFFLARPGHPTADFATPPSPSGEHRPWRRSVPGKNSLIKTPRSCSSTPFKNTSPNRNLPTPSTPETHRHRRTPMELDPRKS